MADLTSPEPIRFYWIDKGINLKVEYQVKYKDRLIKTTAIFDVERPVAKFTSKLTRDSPATNGVAISNLGFQGSKLELHFGLATDPGISWKATVNTPKSSGGKIALVPLIKSLASLVKDDDANTVQTASTGGKFMLEKIFPYNGNPPVQIAAMAIGVLQGPLYSDTPGIPLLANAKAYSRVDEFQTYLIFKPDGNNSIWVTLRVVEWYWTGSAKKKNGTWVFGDDPPPDASSKDPESVDSIKLPTWTNNFKNVDFE